MGSAAEGHVRQLVRKRLEGWEVRQQNRELRRQGWHEYHRVYNSNFSQARDKTYEAVERQLSAMGAEIFEVGALQRGDGDTPQFMLLRTWEKQKVLESIPWLRYQNWHESHIYVRPHGESNLTLIDDLQANAVAQMREDGFQPAVVVQTSPGNFQVWVKHATRMDKELGTAVARGLAARYGGDVKAAAWRHFGRLAGFRNTRKNTGRLCLRPSMTSGAARTFTVIWRVAGSATTETRTRRSAYARCTPNSRRERGSRSSGWLRLPAWSHSRAPRFWQPCEPA